MPLCVPFSLLAREGLPWQHITVWCALIGGAEIKSRDKTHTPHQEYAREQDSKVTCHDEAEEEHD